MNNIPVIKIGIVAVSRDCFPESLAVNRRKAVIAAYEKKFGKEGIYECPICIVESEIHAQQALEDVTLEMTFASFLHSIAIRIFQNILLLSKTAIKLQKQRAPEDRRK